MVTLPSNQLIEAALLALVVQRGKHTSACPSEVARRVSPADWRKLMPLVRDVARQLALRGLLDISQGGKSVSPDEPWKGPIRLRLPSGT